jgi:hypothetical protein
MNSSRNLHSIKLLIKAKAKVQRKRISSSDRNLTKHDVQVHDCNDIFSSRVMSKTFCTV